MLLLADQGVNLSIQSPTSDPLFVISGSKHKPDSPGGAKRTSPILLPCSQPTARIRSISSFWATVVYSPADKGRYFHSGDGSQKGPHDLACRGVGDTLPMGFLARKYDVLESAIHPGCGCRIPHTLLPCKLTWNPQTLDYTSIHFRFHLNFQVHHEAGDSIAFRFPGRGGSGGCPQALTSAVCGSTAAALLS